MNPLRNTAEPGVPGPQFKGACFGVEVRPRAEYGPTFHIWVEDDGIWHEQACSGDAGWLGDLIDQLLEAKDFATGQQRKR